MKKTNNLKEKTMPKLIKGMKHNLETKYDGEENYTVQYFVWGRINEDHKSFYLTPSELENFMNEQNLNKSQKLEVKRLWGMRGIEFEKGFTIERRLKPIEERANV
jgi:hypothetical protein